MLRKYTANKNICERHSLYLRNLLCKRRQEKRFLFHEVQTVHICFLMLWNRGKGTPKLAMNLEFINDCAVTNSKLPTAGTDPDQRYLIGTRIVFSSCTILVGAN